MGKSRLRWENWCFVLNTKSDQARQLDTQVEISSGFLSVQIWDEEGDLGREHDALVSAGGLKQLLWRVRAGIAG